MAMRKTKKTPKKTATKKTAKAKAPKKGAAKRGRPAGSANIEVVQSGGRGYNEKKDLLIAFCGGGRLLYSKDAKNPTEVSIEVCSYDGAPPRVDLQKYIGPDCDDPVKPLGRLPFQMMDAIALNWIARGYRKEPRTALLKAAKAQEVVQGAEQDDAVEGGFILTESALSELRKNEDFQTLIEKLSKMIVKTGKKHAAELSEGEDEENEEEEEGDEEEEEEGDEEEEEKPVKKSKKGATKKGKPVKKSKKSKKDEESEESEESEEESEEEEEEEESEEEESDEEEVEEIDEDEEDEEPKKKLKTKKSAKAKIKDTKSLKKMKKSKKSKKD